MTNEDKELLLKDLCARLPYKVKVNTFTYDKISGEELDSIETLYSIDSDGYITTYECDTNRPICKPYLFPLSSMTEEQRIEASHELGLKKYTINIFGDIESYSEIGDDIAYIDIESINRYINWCYKNHFDYRGLIPMGLAKDATGLNIY